MIATVILRNQNRLYDEFREIDARLFAKIEQRERQAEHGIKEDMDLTGLHELRDCV